MLRLRSYLNPYMTIFIASVVLLFAQANFDLALPDYLSQIVNVGIQQGGVESTVPEAMRTSSYDHLRLFLSEADQQRLSESYRLAQPGDSLWAEQAVDYPLLEEGESLYVLNDLSDSEREALSTPLAKAWLSVAGVEQFMANPEAAQEMGGAAMGGFDPSTLPPAPISSNYWREHPQRNGRQWLPRWTPALRSWASRWCAKRRLPVCALNMTSWKREATADRTAISSVSAASCC